jgi:hypothetical protein
MRSLDVTDQVAALRSVVFDAVDSWNVAHPHPLRSRQERGSVNVTTIFSDVTGAASYSITVVCALSGVPQLTFHGQDLAAIVEHARLALEDRIKAELARRAHKGELDRKFGIAS